MLRLLYFSITNSTQKKSADISTSTRIQEPGLRNRYNEGATESWLDSREKEETFLLSEVSRLALRPNLVDGHRALFSKGAEWPGSGNDHSPNLVSSYARGELHLLWLACPHGVQIDLTSLKTCEWVYSKYASKES
jgi:hypothetical protein